MTNSLAPVVEAMQKRVAVWEAERDSRAIFLDCYARMTANMLQALDSGEFRDRVWVAHLLHRFADYYFDALQAYECAQPELPAVWEQAFAAARQPNLHVLQHLILGVNAHINYDLVFVIVETLRDTWPQATPEQIEQRYQDHCYVNQVIYRTIDSVQDEVVERYSSSTRVIDTALLRLDEWMLQRLISGWREQVWQDATQLLNSPAAEAAPVIEAVKTRALRRGKAVLLEYGWFGLRWMF